MLCLFRSIYRDPEFHIKRVDTDGTADDDNDGNDGDGHNDDDGSDGYGHDDDDDDDGSGLRSNRLACTVCDTGSL